MRIKYTPLKCNKNFEKYVEFFVANKAKKNSNKESFNTLSLIIH